MSKENDTVNLSLHDVWKLKGEYLITHHNGNHPIKLPEYSDWQCNIGGLTFRPHKGQEPSERQRKNQERFLGIIWTKVLGD